MIEGDGDEEEERYHPNYTFSSATTSRLPLHQRPQHRGMLFSCHNMFATGSDDTAKLLPYLPWFPLPQCRCHFTCCTSTSVIATAATARPGTRHSYFLVCHAFHYCSVGATSLVYQHIHHCYCSHSTARDTSQLLLACHAFHYYSVGATSLAAPVHPSLLLKPQHGQGHATAASLPAMVSTTTV